MIRSMLLSYRRAIVMPSCGLALVAWVAPGGHNREAGPSLRDAPFDPSYQAQFAVADGELADSGRNPWFLLEPGYQLVLEHEDERLVVTVLAETRRVVEPCA